tara:strand:- start:326 stop:1732 length:1407 start_codon:yes stop_codon:yes gene_type:complete
VEVPGQEARVAVTVNGRHHTWTVRPGLHPKMASGQPVLIVHGGNYVEVLFCNPFRGGPTVMRPPVEVWANGIRADTSPAPLEITGGRAIPLHVDLGFDQAIALAGPGPEAQEAALKPLGKGRISFGGFGSWRGREVFCWNENKGKPGQANQGGGALIYPHVGYWEDHVEGRWLSHRIMRGWLSRLSVFRFKRGAWESGRLEFDLEPRGSYLGVGADQLSGYSRPLEGDADDLDHEHLGRAAHIVNRWAARDDELAKLIQDALFWDVWHRWHRGGFNPDQLNRGFAQSLFVAAAWGKRLGNTVLAEDMVGYARGLRRDDGHVYFIPQFSGKWEKKIRAKFLVLGFEPEEGESLQDAAERCREHYAAQPDAGITIAFEEQLVCAALKQAEDSLGVPRGESVWGKLADELTPWPSEVLFPDNPALETDHIQGWGHMLPPWRVLGNKSLAHYAKQNAIGDGPAASAPPDLWP